MNSTAPSYLLLIIWVPAAIASATTGDYTAAMFAASVIVFAVANIVTMRYQALRIADKEQQIGHKQRHIEAQQRNIDILNRQLFAHTQTRTEKKDPRL
jgi:uncharacterized membrane protein YhiD involved in acid resistance